MCMWTTGWIAMGKMLAAHVFEFTKKMKTQNIECYIFFINIFAKLMIYFWHTSDRNLGLSSMFESE